MHSPRQAADSFNIYTAAPGGKVPGSLSTDSSSLFYYQGGEKNIQSFHCARTNNFFSLLCTNSFWKSKHRPCVQTVKHISTEAALNHFANDTSSYSRLYTHSKERSKPKTSECHEWYMCRFIHIRVNITLWFALNSCCRAESASVGRKLLSNLFLSTQNKTQMKTQRWKITLWLFAWWKPRCDITGWLVIADKM